MRLLIVLMLVAGAACAGPLNNANPQREAERKAAAAKTADAEAGVAWTGILTDLDQVSTALDAIDWGTIDYGSCTQTVFTGNQRIAVKALKDAGQAQKDIAQSLKAAAKNLMQATRKIERKLQRSEEIEAAEKAKVTTKAVSK